MRVLFGWGIRGMDCYRYLVEVGLLNFYGVVAVGRAESREGTVVCWG